MSGRGGRESRESRDSRDRYRRDYPSRSEEKSRHGRNNAPPSRHIWVGNLPHSISESTLEDHFSQFGELESLACQPGRSYAFINFKNEEGAFAAMRELQGFAISGNPLRIEFAKAEKSSTPSRDDDYLHHRDERSAVRGSPFSHRDPRMRQPSPDPYYPENSKMSDKNAERPSEVLWVGFPALLKVDEVILRKAFSPFGDIEKITSFPGRSYAFVRFKNLGAACRAKETLQGKLFGNPRVHICFAKSDSGSSNSGRNSLNAPSSPRYKSYGHARSSENLRQERDYGSFAGEPAMKSHFISDMESGDPDVNFGRKGSLRTSVGGAFEQRRFQDLEPELGLPDHMYERCSSPTRDRSAHFRDFSPQQFPRKGPFYDDSWDLPEEALLFHGAKKLKTGSLPPDDELPEYPLSGPDQGKHVFPRMFSDFPQSEAPDKSFESGPYGYKQIPDHAMNLIQPYRERSEQWNASHDSFQAGSTGSLPPNPVDWKRLTPESQQPSLSKEWKWEGTIAKGGTPICRARCFPVGKVIDMLLPEFIDCTARTGLDMLAKHYYQASGAWVVFFVPESDADMAFYNEFMHYLEEKQRAAVAKLDERTTLFLVPPSEFSEKVLKVPGKLSISGVILRLDNPGANVDSSFPHPHDINDTKVMPYHGDTSYPKPASPSGPYPSVPSFPNLGKSAVNLSYQGNLAAASPASLSGSAHASAGMPETSNENRFDYMLNQRNQGVAPNWIPQHLQNSNSGARNMALQASNAAADPAVVEGYNAGMPRTLHETSSYSTGVSGFPLAGSSKLPHQEPKPPGPSSMPVSALQSEQLAQLASSLLGHAAQTGKDFRPPSTTNHSESSYRAAAQNYGFPNNQVHSEPPSPQFGQVQLQQPGSNNVPQREFQTAPQGNTQLQSSGAQDDEADPQKRLQATLQLAAALLQQIQQGKGN
ncbi:flowering time control protein FPA-like [Diospyros lotus]|uniref:flowering time control protein FPA-like n=1 Tax=Diospyros lotus TaxID=55363 RepID=UPI0022588818|nr:flowering time control protein FPA-like [Diospyros lotus]